eukprot:471092-Amphidinium_carterae.1
MLIFRKKAPPVTAGIPFCLNRLAAMSAISFQTGGMFQAKASPPHTTNTRVYSASVMARRISSTPSSM